MISERWRFRTFRFPPKKWKDNNRREEEKTHTHFLNLADRMELLLQPGFSFPPAVLAAVAGLVLLVLLLAGGLRILTGSHTHKKETAEPEQARISLVPFARLPSFVLPLQTAQQVVWDGLQLLPHQLLLPSDGLQLHLPYRPLGGVRIYFVSSPPRGQSHPASREAKSRPASMLRGGERAGPGLGGRFRLPLRQLGHPREQAYRSYRCLQKPRQCARAECWYGKAYHRVDCRFLHPQVEQRRSWRVPREEQDGWTQARHFRGWSFHPSPQASRAHRDREREPEPKSQFHPRPIRRQLESRTSKSTQLSTTQAEGPPGCSCLLVG